MQPFRQSPSRVIARYTCEIFNRPVDLFQNGLNREQNIISLSLPKKGQIIERNGNDHFRVKTIDRLYVKTFQWLAFTIKNQTGIFLLQPPF